MKYLGIDISSKSTGWSLLEDGKLVDFGKINPTGTMIQGQKLNLFDVEITKILNKCEPDLIAIEDVIHVKAITTTKILARYNGIAIKTAYSYNKKEPTLVEPTKWKKYLRDCTGGAKKAEIQLSVCKLFNLLPQNKIEYYEKRLENTFLILKQNIDEENIKNLKKELGTAKRKKDIEKVKKIQTIIKECQGAIDKLKRSNKKEFDSEISLLSMEIYTDSGLNEDEADATGIAYYLYLIDKGEINE